MKAKVSRIAAMAVAAALFAAIAVGAVAQGKERIVIRIATVDDAPYAFYHELLSTALKEAGYDAEVVPSVPVPQKRALYMLDNDEISLHWMVASAERDAAYVPVNVGLTNGLIGNRILFIPQGAQAIYDKVRTLDDFRNLGKVGGFGKNWFDVNVWKANNLKYYEVDGDWTVIYNMVAVGGRGIDYFSRGMNEIVAESKAHGNLEIEKNLVLVYDRDFKFYLGKSGAAYKDVIETALKKAKASGLIDRLIRKHWAADFTALNFDKRIKIILKTPK
jgi:hypothetical protein